MYRTERLVLRRWREADHAPFAEMNADPAVMEHFPARLTPEESGSLTGRIEDGFNEHGFGLWALEVSETGNFIGFTGLSVPRFDAHFMPTVEVGWRLARYAWGKGYATEAARAALEIGFTVARLAEIVSFTATANVRSQAVMRRIGMTHDDADDFDHPNLPAGGPLTRHVLWRITAHRWNRLGTSAGMRTDPQI